MMAMVIVICNM